MSIVDKFKKLWSSEEAKELRTEVSETAKELAKDAKVVASKGASKGKEVLDDVKEKVEETAKKFRSENISFEDFQKVDLRVGTIKEVSKVEKSDKLYQLTVDFGEENTRTVVSGIAKHYTMKSLTDSQALFVTNLEPRSIMGIESQAMIVALSDDRAFSLVSPQKQIAVGTRAS